MTDPHEDYESRKLNAVPMHHRLHSFSSATSTEETVFSDYSDSDSDDSDIDELPRRHEMIDRADGDEKQPPPFETLVDDDDPLRAMSFSVNEEMVEVVPTDMVESVLPLWNKDWDEHQKERIELQKAIKLKRRHTHNDRSALYQPQNEQLQEEHLNNSKDFRRNSSDPHNFARSHPSAVGRKMKCKYGSHPSQPFPHSRAPNPIVVRSSKKIGKKHERYALTAGMMLGIRESVGGAQAVEAEIEFGRWEEWERNHEEESLMDEGKENGDDAVSETNGSEDNVSFSDDRANSTSSVTATKDAPTEGSTTLTLECQRVSKYKFPPHQFYLGSNTSKPLPHKYKFKVYAPLVFARIRSLFGVEKQPFLHSICGKFNFYEFASNARSGQFFFYSHDGRYMIKTLTYTESKFLREILPDYYRHLSLNPNTFLTRFYGMYRVHMPHLNNKRLHFIIMKSVFSTENKIDRVWDLKGSKTGRKSKEGDSVGKDLDILEEGKRFKFAKPGAKNAFLEQLKTDATFLARLGIMDYSLLLGMHRCKEDDNDSVKTPEVPVPIGETTQIKGQVEPCRSNTPLRRGVLKRAINGGTKTTDDDGFKALEDLDQVITSKSNLSKRSERELNDKCECFKTPIEEAPLTSVPNNTPSPVRAQTAMDRELPVPNPVTLRDDEGIEGGFQLADGTLSVQEIYYCGIIDILQYYNARKIGETVMKQAAGNLSQDISCVDPESYGKRFVKFISNLVDE